MNHAADILNIEIKQKDGMFFATSEDEPTFFVSALDASTLFRMLPIALADLYKSTHNVEVRAFPTSKGEFGHKPWAIVPLDLIASRSVHPTP